MNEVINELVSEWSNRIPSGIIDMKNEEQLFILLQVMNEYIGDRWLVSEWMDNIKNNNLMRERN
jgi:hypothetical protein